MAVNFRYLIDLFFCAGQSNTRGRGDSTLSYVVAKLRSYFFSEGVLYHSEDPMPNINGEANTGSLFPAFGKRWAEITNRGSIFCNAAKGGSTIVVDDGFGLWRKGVDIYYSNMISEALDTINFIENKTTFQIMSKNMIWGQGENDANNNVSTADYQSRLDTLFTDFKADLGIDNFFINALGKRSDGLYVNEYNLVRNGQYNVANSRADTYIITDIAKNFPEEGKMSADNVHYSQAGYNEQGTLGADNILSILT
jgi:hypothetical protein